MSLFISHLADGGGEIASGDIPLTLFILVGQEIKAVNADHQISWEGMAVGQSCLNGEIIDYVVVLIVMGWTSKCYCPSWTTIQKCHRILIIGHFSLPVNVTWFNDQNRTSCDNYGKWIMLWNWNSLEGGWGHWVIVIALAVAFQYVYGMVFIHSTCHQRWVMHWQFLYSWWGHQQIGGRDRSWVG